MTMPNFVDGQLVDETDLNALADAIDVLNAAVSFAKYVQSTTQSIATGTGSFTKIQYNGTPEATTAGISASGTGNTDFTINETGLWLIIASIGYVANGAPTGINGRAVFVLNSALTNRYGASYAFPGTSLVGLQASASIRVAAPLTISIGTLQSSGASLSTEAAAILPCNVTFSRLGP
jgi:hypothetical protein